MSSLKSIICGILVFLSMSSYSQNISKSNYKSQAEKAANAMKAGLKLNNVQAKEVKDIEEQFFAELLAPDKDSAHLEARALKIERLQKQKEQALQKVLTSIQWKQYQSYLEAQKRRYQQEMEGRKQKQKGTQSQTTGITN